MSKEVILTGIRANNDLHIGNYFGALLPMVDMAKNRSNDYQVNLFVPDLHSFTTPIDHSRLQAQILHNLKIFVAAGLPLDNPDIRIYRQSHIPAHSELTWILGCFTGFGELGRMTQFKIKSFMPTHENLLLKVLSPVAQMREHSISAQDARLIVNIFVRLQDVTGPLSEHDAETVNRLNDGILDIEATRAHSLHRAYQDRTETLNSTPPSVGLFNYPVLMASDILLYGAKYIPVGDDQTQHLEFTRNIAERMNKQFGDIFVIPAPVAMQHEFFGKDQGLRIKDLIEPTKKMSKSDKSGNGVVFLGDSPEIATKKIMSATTDSLQSIKRDPIHQPGVTNLLDFLMYFRNINEHYKVDDPRPTDGYIELKKAVSSVVSKFLGDFQKRMSEVSESQILEKLEQDEKAMAEVANATLLKVQRAVGLRPKE